jgi:hypothetical protein
VRFWSGLMRVPVIWIFRTVLVKGPQAPLRVVVLAPDPLMESLVRLVEICTLLATMHVAIAPCSLHWRVSWVSETDPVQVPMLAAPVAALR